MEMPKKFAIYILEDENFVAMKQAVEFACLKLDEKLEDIFEFVLDKNIDFSTEWNRWEQKEYDGRRVDFALLDLRIKLVEGQKAIPIRIDNSNLVIDNGYVLNGGIWIWTRIRKKTDDVIVYSCHDDIVKYYEPFFEEGILKRKPFAPNHLDKLPESDDLAELFERKQKSIAKRMTAQSKKTLYKSLHQLRQLLKEYNGSQDDLEDEYLKSVGKLRNGDIHLNDGTTWKVGRLFPVRTKRYSISSYTADLEKARRYIDQLFGIIFRGFREDVRKLIDRLHNDNLNDRVHQFEGLFNTNLKDAYENYKEFSGLPIRYNGMDTFLINIVEKIRSRSLSAEGSLDALKGFYKLIEINYFTQDIRILIKKLVDRWSQTGQNMTQVKICVEMTGWETKDFSDPSSVLRRKGEDYYSFCSVNNFNDIKNNWQIINKSKCRAEQERNHFLFSPFFERMFVAMFTASVQHSATEVKMGVVADNDRLEIVYSDNGRGVSGSFVEIFNLRPEEPLSLVNFETILAHAKAFPHIVYLHDGEMRVKSNGWEFNPFKPGGNDNPVESYFTNGIRYTFDFPLNEVREE